MVAENVELQYRNTSENGMPVLYTTGEKVFKIKKRKQGITKTRESKNGESNSPVYMQL